MPTKRAAEDALAIERAAIVTGTWVDPDRVTESVGDYAATFIATNGYRERSRAMNERLLAQWIATTQLVTIAERRHAVALGDRPLASTTAQDVRLWNAAVAAESRRRAAARHQRAAASPQAVNAANRAWAAEKAPRRELAHQRRRHRKFCAEAKPDDEGSSRFVVKRVRCLV